MGNGHGIGELDTPIDIAVDASGNVYVVELWVDRVQKFSASGTFLTTWGDWVDFTQAATTGVAVDSSGNVYVADLESHRILIFGTQPSKLNPHLGAK